jgi:hypothetical protein
MPQQFSISQVRASATAESVLRDEIHAHTQNESETSRILSALRRFGVDPSIERFELIPSAARGFQGTSRTSWTVRALRKGVPAGPA